MLPTQNSEEPTLWNEQALSQFLFGAYQSAYYGPDHRINLTHPEWGQVLTAPLSKSAGGLELCRNKDGGPVFKDKDDPDYLAMLAALKIGHEALRENPRVDMPKEYAKWHAAGAKPTRLQPPKWMRTATRSRAVEFRKNGWTSKNAKLEANSLDPQWNGFNREFLNGSPVARSFSVCTEKEENPWIIIRLAEESLVTEVDIVNRFPDCRHFTRTLTMWLSTDKKNWRQVWKAPRVENRWRVKLPPKQRAKYIKLGLRETEYLDLKHVFVYQAGAKESDHKSRGDNARDSKPLQEGAGIKRQRAPVTGKAHDGHG